MASVFFNTVKEWFGSTEPLRGFLWKWVMEQYCCVNIMWERMIEKFQNKLRAIDSSSWWGDEKVLLILMRNFNDVPVHTPLWKHITLGICFKCFSAVCCVVKPNTQQQMTMLDALPRFYDDSTVIFSWCFARTNRVQNCNQWNRWLILLI